MKPADVRDVEVLQDFVGRLHEYGSRLSQDVDGLRFASMRAEQILSAQWPNYWKSQLADAEKALAEAKENFSRASSPSRDGTRPPATEAAVRVRRCEQRRSTCEEKLRTAKDIALFIQNAVDELRGPIGQLDNNATAVAKAAATELQTIVHRLRDYQDLQPGDGS